MSASFNEVANKQYLPPGMNNFLSHSVVLGVRGQD